MFVTEKAAISAALSVAVDVVNNSDKIPIMTHVLFDRLGDRLTITGSNLDQEISASFSAEISRDFEAFACPAKLLVGIVRNIADGFNVGIEAVRMGGKLNEIRISSGKFRTKLPVLPSSDFPTMSADNLPYQLSLSAISFLKALKAVSFASETNEQRYAYCGVRLDPEPDGLLVVATDANRLARRFLPAIEFDQDLYGVPGVTIPNAAVSAIVKILEKQEDVTIDLSEDRICVATPDATVTSKLIDGTFLPYKPLVPNPSSIVATVSGPALSAALARVLTVSPDKMSGVLFDFRVGRLTLHSNNGAAGEADDEIPANSTGEIRQGYNGRHVIAALDHLDKEEVEIIIGEGRMPAYIRAVGDQNTIMMAGAVRMQGASAATVPMEGGST